MIKQKQIGPVQHKKREDKSSKVELRAIYMYVHTLYIHNTCILCVFCMQTHTCTCTYYMKNQLVVLKERRYMYKPWTAVSSLFVTSNVQHHLSLALLGFTLRQIHLYMLNGFIQGDKHIYTRRQTRLPYTLYLTGTVQCTCSPLEHMYIFCN